MFSLERVWRGLLALVIAGTIPLSIWGTGCDSQPLVQPDASGQSGGSPGSGGSISGSGGAGGSQPRDASTDGPSPCCPGQSLAKQCSADGRQLRTCFYSFTNANTKECSGGVAGVYAYVWSVQDCPNGCLMVDGGASGTGGNSGTGGGNGTGGFVGSSAMCQ